jgi:hypothetical protein
MLLFMHCYLKYAVDAVYLNNPVYHCALAVHTVGVMSGIILVILLKH